MKMYVDIIQNMFKTVLNFAINEGDEIILLPYVSGLLPSLA